MRAKVDVEIVTCYKAGTLPIMEIWAGAIKRHTSNVRYGVTILVERGGAAELKDVFDMLPARVIEVEIGHDCVSVARVHGKMLDCHVPSGIEADVFCTMDSDCFPVADGWMEGLVGMLERGCRVSGILHPWAPPPDDMKKTKIEWRVRSQHCWKNTHVACQVMKTDDFVSLGVNYSGGDDTGLLVPRKASEMGWGVVGYMPSRCPTAKSGKLNPEFNRYVSLVYGDKVFHLGGYTRVSMGDSDVYADEFGWAKERVLKEKGAEFLLDDSLSYKFVFDREEDVAKEKMDRIFGTHMSTGMEALRVR